MTLKEIIKILSEQQAKYVLLLCHRSADADAICAAYAVQGLLKRLVPNVLVEIGAPLGISKPAKQLLSSLPISVHAKPNVESADVIFLVDLNTIEQLEQVGEIIKKSVAPLIIIDHHAANSETTQICKLCIIDDTASATCEIVCRLFEEANIQPSLDEAKALFLGIAFDTRHFALANSPTFKAICGLVDVGLDAQETLALSNLPLDQSERLARLKACKRAKILRVNGWIVVFSHVSAFQASAAKSLVDLGAHMAAIAGLKNGNIELSLRCTRQFKEQTGVHLGTDIAAPLGEFLGGVGGGHAMAAGARGLADSVEPALKQCLQLLREKIIKTE